MNFLWNDNTEQPQFAPLQHDIKTDVLIIGGGMAGILCARVLEDAGVDYILVEGQHIGQGITKGTTAVLTAQHDILYQDLIKKFGQERASHYLYSNLEALQRIKTLAQEIDCDYTEKPSMIYSLDDPILIEQEAQALHTLGFEAYTQHTLPLPISIAGAVVFPHMAEFHPLRFLTGMARSLRIYEETFVQKISGTTAYTKDATIEAKDIIFATHYPILDTHGMYPAKRFQKRSYVIAYKNGPQLGFTMEDLAANGFYFRNYTDLLLVRGVYHLT